MADLQAAIDAKIRKLQQLRELAADPEIREMLEGLVRNNGKGHTPASPPSTQPADETQRPTYGLLKKSVEDVLRKASKPVPTDWIVLRLQDEGFRFQSSKPAIAVNEALNTLSKKGQARIHHTEGVKNFWEAISPAQENLM